MARTSSTRSRNLEDLFTLKTRQIEPTLSWVPRAEDGALVLQRLPTASRTGERVKTRVSRREVRDACKGFLQLALACEELTDADVPRLADAIAKMASRYGTLYGDVPNVGHTAEGTLDQWIVELYRFLDLWEIKEALRKRSNEQAVARRIERRPADATRPERFVFVPRTEDLDGSIVIASAHERWTQVNLVTGAQEEMPVFGRMRDGSQRTRLWIVFSTLLNRRMVGRLNLALHPFERSSASVGITPHGLLAMVYARLWLDVVTASLFTPPTVRHCKACNTPLPEHATARRAYCDNGGRCRQAYRRKQLAA